MPGCARTWAQVKPTPFWPVGTEKQLPQFVPSTWKLAGAPASAAGLPVEAMPGIELEIAMRLSKPYCE